MSAQLDAEGTNNNNTNQSELKQWLTDNNLQNVIPILNKQNMTMEELIEWGEDEHAFKEYLKSLEVPSPSILRICFKIKKKLNPKRNNNNCNAVRILISDEENNCISQLNEYLQNILLMNDELQKSYDSINIAKQKLKSDINAQFNLFINEINNKQQNILKQLDILYKNKQNNINTNVHKISQKQNLVENAIQKCNDLFENNSINRLERKQIIVNTTNNILKEQIPLYPLKHSSKIAFEFNQNIMKTLLSNIAIIYDEQKEMRKYENEMKCSEKKQNNYDEQKKGMKFRECIYEYDYDNNGVCYLLGTNFNTTKWINPAKRGLIALQSFKWPSFCDSINNMVGRSVAYTETSKIKNAWISLDFGNNIKIKPKKYTLRNSSSNWRLSVGYLRNWNFMGSNDGVKWTVIKQHGGSSWFSSDKSLNEEGQSHTWTINNCDTFYQMFKIQMIGTNSEGHWRICANGFEIYGNLIKDGKV